MARKKIGRWENFSSLKPGKLDEAIEQILASYGDEVYQATEEGLDNAEKILKNNLKVKTPKNTGELADSWKSKGKKYKLVRYVGSNKTVIGKNGQKISLANIFEYSTTRGNPFIQNTVDNSANEMANAIVSQIKKI